MYLQISDLKGQIQGHPDCEALYLGAQLGLFCYKKKQQDTVYVEFSCTVTFDIE